MNFVVGVFGPAVTAATGFEANAQPSVLGVTLTDFLVGVFAVSILMALYLTLAGTIQSAHSGQFLGERWHSLWVPLRAVLAWMLLLPLPVLGGLAGIHALLFWLLAIGTGFANRVGLAGIESTTANGFVANATTLTAEPLASLLARHTFNSLTCVETINRVESLPGGYPLLGVTTKDDAPSPGVWDQLGPLQPPQRRVAGRSGGHYAAPLPLWRRPLRGGPVRRSSDSDPHRHERQRRQRCPDGDAQ